VSTYFGLAAGERAKDAERALADARAAQAETDRVAAELLLDAGQREAEAGDVGRGLHAFVAALRRAPPDDARLRGVVRRGFAAWAERLPTLVRYERLDSPAYGCRFVGPDGKAVFLQVGDRR